MLATCAPKQTTRRVSRAASKRIAQNPDILSIRPTGDKRSSGVCDRVAMGPRLPLSTEPRRKTPRSLPWFFQSNAEDSHGNGGHAGSSFKTPHLWRRYGKSIDEEGRPIRSKSKPGQFSKQLKWIVSGLVGISVVWNLLATWYLKDLFRWGSVIIDEPFHALKTDYTGSAPVFVDTDSRLAGIPEFLPIYWINLDRSEKRRKLMEDMFDRLGVPDTTQHRVSAHDTTRIASMVKDGLLRFENGIKLVPKDDEIAYYHHIRDEYTHGEGGCLMSHLDAIRMAYEAGHEVALVLEDDAKLTTDFLKSWRNHTALAPRNWRILQIALMDPTVIKHGLALDHQKDPWMSWQPDHWSTRAYLIRRDGMKELLDNAYKGRDPTSGKDSWVFSGPKTLVADEYLYYRVGHASVYTSSFPWIDSFDVDTTMQTADADYSLPTTAAEAIPHYDAGAVRTRPESLLVLSYGEWDGPDVAMEHLRWLKLDAETLCGMHAVCKWRVHVLYNDKNTTGFGGGKGSNWFGGGKASIWWEDPKVAKAIKDLPPFVALDAKPATYKRNRFSLLAPYVDEMGNYDLVLFKDNDQRLPGFPWNTLVQKKAKESAIIVSPLRQKVDDWLVANRDYTNSAQDAAQDVPPSATSKLTTNVYHVQDAFHWKDFKLCLWSTRMFESLQATNVPYLESYFTLMDGAFAEWFFRRVLISDFLDQPTAWGPDMMWCAAAEDWATANGQGGRIPCTLVPMVSKQEHVPATKIRDGWRAGGGKDVDSSDKLEALGRQMLYLFQMNHWKFFQWTAGAKIWKDLVYGKSQFEIQFMCKGNPLFIPSCLSYDDCDLQACVDKALEVYGAQPEVLATAVERMKD